jgi:hypothetical protein
VDALVLQEHTVGEAGAFADELSRECPFDFGSDGPVASAHDTQVPLSHAENGCDDRKKRRSRFDGVQFGLGKTSVEELGMDDFRFGAEPRQLYRPVG